MSTKQGFDLSFEASLENLHEVRDYIDQAGNSFGVDSGVLADLRLVVDEAVTNVILHGYKGRSGQVEVHMERDGDAVVILIRDQAGSFDSSQVDTPHLDTALADRPFGGMGLFLIRKMTDEAVFRSLPGQGNELRIVKRQAFG
jgi:serine/threonine-protein kinase RsbW